MRNSLIFAAIAFAGASQAATWTWTFDGNYNELGGGTSLTSNGNIAFEADTINGEAATVAKLTKGDFLSGQPADPWFGLANPIGANGGGTRTNVYSILMDVKLPGTGWQSLMQSGSSHAATGTVDAGVAENDGDWFINTANGLGISGNYTDPGNSTLFTNDVWTRIVLTIDQSNTATGDDRAYKSYVNGVLQNTVQSPSNFGLDGRYALGSSFWFFADEDREVRDVWYVNNVMVFDRYLTASEVRDFGGAQAGAPTAVPEPMTMSLLALGALIARKRKKA